MTFNTLTALNVSGCTGLEYLSCDNTALTTLDVSDCPSFMYLSCDEGVTVIGQKHMNKENPEQKKIHPKALNRSLRSCLGKLIPVFILAFVMNCESYGLCCR